jgi:hypothetical protein
MAECKCNCKKQDKNNILAVTNIKGTESNIAVALGSVDIESFPDAESLASNLLCLKKLQEGIETSIKRSEERISVLKAS